MSAQPAPADPHADPGQPADDADYYRRLLHRMMDVGAELVDKLRPQAEPANPDHPPQHPTPEDARHIAEAYDRITRAVRRSIMLARHIAEHPVPPAAEHRSAARKRIIRVVEDTIQRAAGTNPTRTDTESLDAELLERLDSPDLDDDIANRPVADIIAEICRDLGIAGIPGGPPHWRRRTPADLAALHARATQTPNTPPPRAATNTTTVLRPLPPGLAREAHQNWGEDCPPEAPREAPRERSAEPQRPRQPTRPGALSSEPGALIRHYAALIRDD